MYGRCELPLLEDERPVEVLAGESAPWRSNERRLWQLCHDYTMPCSTMLCRAMRCDAMRCGAMRCDAMRCDAMRCSPCAGTAPNTSVGVAGANAAGLGFAACVPAAGTHHVSGGVGGGVRSRVLTEGAEAAPGAGDQGGVAG